MSTYADIKDAAYSYVAFDLPIIPLCSSDHRGCSDKHIERCKSPGKAPVLKNWTQHTQTTEDQLDEWFRINKYANIGLVLGQSNSYNLVGVDIDGALGEETFQEVSKNQEVPDTWEFTSGNGRRLLYLLPDGLATQKCKVAWKEGHEELAFLAQGQQTVLPPSKHPNGSFYTWKEDHSPVDCDLALAPEWIVNKIKVTSNGTNQPEDLPFASAAQYSKPVILEENLNAVSQGGRSDKLTRIVGSLCAKRVLSKEVIIQTAQQQNLMYCDPPLAESEIVAMVESIYTAEMAKHQQFLEKQRKKQEMHPAALASKFITIMHNRGVHWKYNETKGRMYRTTKTEGPWELLSQEAAVAEIHAFLVEIDGALASTGMCRELYQQVVIWSTNTFGSGEELNLGDNPYSQYVVVRNGVLDWQKGELVPWSIDYQHTTRIEADWLEDISEEASTMWDEALHQWLDDEETIMFLQEYIGYTLLPSCKMRTAVFLEGEGANGKSLFIDAIHSLFANTAMVTQPAALATRFGTSCIIDKLLLLCSDIDATYLDKTGVLKQLIAGDRIRAEYKGGKEFDFVPVCKLLFSANKLPKSADKSHGWYSRLQIVHFPHMFKENAQYYETFMKTITSPSGRAALLQWAVVGLRRLHENGSWTLGMSMETSKMNYRKDNDNTLAFISDQLEVSPLLSDGYKTALVLKGVYETYTEWCEEQGIKPVGQPEFTSRVQTTYEIKPLKWKVSNKWRSQRSILNCKFKEEGCLFDGKTSYDLANNINFY